MYTFPLYVPCCATHGFIKRYARHYLIIVSVRCLVHRANQLSEAYTHSFFDQQKVVKNPLDAAVR